MELIQFIGIAAGALLLNVAAIFLTRYLIWSIVWCDRGGKYNNMVKKTKKKEQSFFSRFSMNYLKESVGAHEKAFRFWIGVKRAFEILCLFSIIADLVFVFTYGATAEIAKYYAIVYGALSFVAAIVMIFQFGFNQDTKYDRERMKKKKK